MDNIKGQWNSLKRWQQNRLVGWAINKNWKMYWFMKEIWLSTNLKQKEQEA